MKSILEREEYYYYKDTYDLLPFSWIASWFSGTILD